MSFSNSSENEGKELLKPENSSGKTDSSEKFFREVFMNEKVWEHVDFSVFILIIRNSVILKLLLKLSKIIVKRNQEIKILPYIVKKSKIKS